MPSGTKEKKNLYECLRVVCVEVQMAMHMWTAQEGVWCPPLSPIISSLETWSLKEPILGCWPASLKRSSSKSLYGSEVTGT